MNRSIKVKQIGKEFNIGLVNAEVNETITNKKRIIYLVGHSGPEHQWVKGAYDSYDKALKVFQKIRLDLLDNAKSSLEWSKKDAKEHLDKGVWYDGEKISEESLKHFKDTADKGSEMYIEIIERLSETDPDKIDNYPQETPYIHKEELK